MHLHRLHQWSRQVTSRGKKGGSEEIFGKENTLIFLGRKIYWYRGFISPATSLHTWQIIIFFHNKNYQCTSVLKITVQAWKAEESNCSADQLPIQGCWMGSHIIWELFWSCMKCQLLCHFLWSFTTLDNAFAGHSILSFLMKILKVEISQRNKEDKFPDP